MARSRTRRHMLDHIFIERDEPDRVVLTDSEKRQRRREVLRVLELRDFAAGVAHRSTGVNEQMYSRVSVALILFYVEPIGASEQLPIEVAQIVAGHVLPMLGEVGREAEIR